jgi:trehalose synthase
MLHLVDVGTQSLERYRDVVGHDVVDELRELARPLRGVRVLNVNATPYGGGVSEMLRSVVPLLNALGLQAEWRVIAGEKEFFEVTKWFHNALQGATGGLTEAQKNIYLEFSEKNARLVQTEHDIYMIHDPQPAALRALLGDRGARWIWRCHIDTAQPNPAVWNFLRPFVEVYDVLNFTMEEFVPAGLPRQKVHLVLPAIDPLSPKNMDLPDAVCRGILNWLGVRWDRPTMTQVSRFDPWKDPLGTIEAYRLVKEEIPDVGLYLIGGMALDDPEGWDIYARVLEEGREDADLHVYTNFTGVDEIGVNAFQRLSDVVVQKSIREGFGLVVSESLWKGTPVVAGRTGGIPIQLEGGGYLVDTVEETAQRVAHLLRHEEEARELGRAGRERVRRRFLITRLLRDLLRLFDRLAAPLPSTAKDK